MVNYKDTIKSKILKRINEKSIADFIIQEIEDNLGIFNPFRLENILENIELFVVFIEELDQHNTNLYLANLRVNNIDDKPNLLDWDGNPYISENGRDLLSQAERILYFDQGNKEITKNTTLIKGRFLLSMADFAQGSNCRVQNKYEHKIDSEYNVK